MHDDGGHGSGVVMAWIVLAVSGVLETVWASALAESRGLSRPVPTVLFGVAVVLSMVGLGFALRTIPVGTGYAVWVGIGAVGTAAYGMVALGEPATVARLTCLVLIIGGVVGLKVLH
jgi:quaternary ammonium compound-resistance protein SugE